MMTQSFMQETQGILFADFLNLLQKAGEDVGLMDIDNERQDRWVPPSVPYPDGVGSGHAQSHAGDLPQGS
jgi:hypothetical protein